MVCGGARKAAGDLAVAAGERGPQAGAGRKVHRAVRAKNTMSSRVQSRIKMLEKLERTEVVAVARGRGTSGWRSRRIAGRRCCAARAWASATKREVDFRGVDLAVQEGREAGGGGAQRRGQDDAAARDGRPTRAERRRRDGAPGRAGIPEPGDGGHDGPDAELLGHAQGDGERRARGVEIRTLLGGFGFSGRRRRSAWRCCRAASASGWRLRAS